MLKQTSKNFRKYFFLEFTKELIRSTNTYKELRIKKEVKLIVHQSKIPVAKRPLKKESINFVIKDKIKRDSEVVSQMKREDPFGEFFKGFQKSGRRVKKRSFPLLKIPESPLPETFQHVRPRPTFNKINLGKLNPLIRDPMVKVIECNGPEERIIVMGRMGRKNTSITLSDDEVEGVIRNFSQATKIPVSEGAFRVVFGRLVLSAIVSEILGSKFLIKKLSGPPSFF
ncbi:MAG TPA: hypothetical protein ENH99_01205 [Candidatus Pacearchaeota archaeon]|nr:hypothetical protein [Candidatus Pacearchaeota archaeon]